MRYYIADCHFFHSGMNNRMDKRGFESAEEMNEYMISQWNSRVRKNDEVVILGDLSIGKAEETNALVKRLKGKKYLILGNHDSYIKRKEADLSLYERINGYDEMNDNGRKVILSHYFIPTYSGQFRRDKNGNPKTWMLYGHVHNTMDMKLIDDYCDMVRQTKRIVGGYDDPQFVPMQAINCFCMYSDYVPLTLDEWIELEKTRREKFPYHKDWKYGEDA